MLFIGLKYLGAAYLFYLGVGMLRGAWRKLRNPEATAAQAEQVDVHQPFRKALLLSLSNPKAILFSSPSSSSSSIPAMPIRACRSWCWR